MLSKSVDVVVMLRLVLFLCAFSSLQAYSKYGRGCSDIGCLPSEECIIASDSCSYNQRDGKDCGSYPTCKKRSGGAGSTASVNPSGSVLNPGYPHGLQPVNPYNPSFIFGQQPYYPMPGGTGGPPGGSAGILGGSGGGLAPPPGYGGGGYQNPNMYNKPPPQFQNQNPYNRQTQSSAHSSAAQRVASGGGMHSTLLLVSCVASALLFMTAAQRRRISVAASST